MWAVDLEDTARRLVLSALQPTLPFAGEGRCRMDLSDLIDRNAAFTPDKSRSVRGQTLTYAAFAANRALRTR